VALDGVVEGWVTVERKVALPPQPRRAASGIIMFFAAGVSSHLRQAGPSHLLRHLLGRHPLSHLHRRHHHVQVSSPLLRCHPLSLPPLISVLVHCVRCHMSWHADGGMLLVLTEDVQIWKAMSEYAAAPVSSGGSGDSGLKQDGGGARRRQGIRGGRGGQGDEAPLLPLLEAVEALPLLSSPRRPHCFNCTVVEALPLFDGGPRRPVRWPEEIRQQRPTASTSTGVGEQSPIWVQRVQIWALILFYF
jgi:hypothetical protein